MSQVVEYSSEQDRHKVDSYIWSDNAPMGECGR